MKNRDNLDLLLYGEMVFSMSKQEGLQLIIMIIIIIIIIVIMIIIIIKMGWKY